MSAFGPQRKCCVPKAWLFRFCSARVASADRQRHIDLVLAKRPKMTEAMAARLLQKPLYLAAAMVAAGDAAAMVAGRHKSNCAGDRGGTK